MRIYNKKQLEIIKLASKDEIKTSLNGLYVDGEITVATNGHMLLMVKSEQMPVNDWPISEIKWSNNDKPFIIPFKTIEKVLKNIPKKVNLPNIKIRMNGYTACALLGKAIISATFHRKNRRIYLLAAITPVEKRHQMIEINIIGIKTKRFIVGTEGYLVYFGTGVSGWFELIPLTDKRFNKYEEELMESI